MHEARYPRILLLALALWPSGSRLTLIAKFEIYSVTYILKNLIKSIYIVNSEISIKLTKLAYSKYQIKLSIYYKIYKTFNSLLIVSLIYVLIIRIYYLDY